MLRRLIFRVVVAAIALVLMIALAIGPDVLIFDYLVPRIPGEQVQGLGVYTAQVLCVVNYIRKRTPLGFDLLECGNNQQDIMRVILAVNKGGSVFGARMAYEFAWACGWCPVMAHNQQTTWPPQPDYLPTYEGDTSIAIPMALHWEQYAFRNSSKQVKCVVLTRDPVKYAWDGGEPALWDISKQMRQIKGWKELLNWSWSTFAEKSMENTHAVLLTAMKRKECVRLKFDDFSTNYDAEVEKWLSSWEVAPKAKEKLITLASRHDLNRLTPEQLAAHHHVSGKGMSKADLKELDDAIRSNSQVMALLTRQQKDLGYT